MIINLLFLRIVIAIKIHLIYNYHRIVYRLKVFATTMSIGILKITRNFGFYAQMNSFPVISNLKKANFVKRHGIDVFSIFVLCLISVFFGVPNLYALFQGPMAKDFGMSLDTVYRFLGNPNFNWRKLHLLFAKQAIDAVSGQKAGKTIRAFIVDDTCIERPDSFKTELVSRMYDHVDHRYFRGFGQLTLGWYDGKGFFPLNFAIDCAKKDENLLFGIDKAASKKTCGYVRRKESRESKPALVVKMLKQALNAKIPATHVLMDTWFYSGKLLWQIANLGMRSVARIKTNLKFISADKNCHGNGKMSQSEILERLRVKLNDRNKDVYWVTVKNNEGMLLKLVFVNACGKNKFISIVTDDLELSAEDIVGLYARRWSIETNFKAQKQFFKLDSECQGHLFDSIIAFATIASIRYIVTELKRRMESDDSLLGGVFRDLVSDTQKAPFRDALNKLLELIKDFRDYLRSHKALKHNKRLQQDIDEYLTTKMKSWFDDRLGFIQKMVASAYEILVPKADNEKAGVNFAI